MFIAGVVCLCLAALVGFTGLRTLTRQPGIDVTGQVLRAVVPTQLAASVILTAGGIVALAAPPQTGLVVLIVCVVGAVGTVAAGSWRSARFATRGSGEAGCGGSCAGCTKICQ